MNKISYLVALFCLCCVSDIKAQLDPAFGNNGIVRRSSGQFKSLVVLPDNSIIAVGSGVYPQTFLLAKYHADGVPDSSFAVNGEYVDNLSSYPSLSVVQSNGRIITNDNRLRGFTPNGSIDPSFGSYGKVLTQMTVSAMTLQPDDKIIIGGYDFRIRRYSAGGWPDTSFGGTGEITTLFDTAAGSLCRALIVQPDGKILAGGEIFFSATGLSKYVVARYNPNGGLDTSFNHTGKQITDIGTGNGVIGWDMARQGDGKVIQCGSGDSSIVLVRYNADGGLDTSFNHTGIIFYTGGLVEAYKIRVSSIGKYIVGGTTADNSRFILHRFWADGRMDSSFGANGIVAPQLNLCDADNSLFDIALLPSDEILAAGQSSNCSGNTDGVLVKFTAEGQLAVSAVNAAQGSLQVYPNPAEQQITVICPRETEDAKVFITDLSGRRLYSSTVEKNITSVTLDIGGLPAGSYFISSKNGDGKSRFARFIKI